MLVTFSLSEFNLKKQMYTSWEFHVDDLSESSRKYGMMIVNRLRSSWIIRRNHEVQWPDNHLRYWNYSNGRTEMHAIYHQWRPWFKSYLFERKWTTKTQRWIFSATKILDAGYKPACASLDDVIKSCENLHLEEQHQLKILLQKYEHLFDSKLGESKTEHGTN
jgi:hypothetical protein